MGRTAALGALALLTACHCAAPLQAGEGAPADAAWHDGGPGDGGPGDGDDLTPSDASPAVTLELTGAASTKLAIGQHAVLQLTVTPAGAAVNAGLEATPCLLKLKGTMQAPVRKLTLSLAAGNSGAEVVVFAPPDAPPEATCAPSVATGTAKLKAPSFTVKPPTYVVHTLGDHPSIEVIQGMQVTTIGTLSEPWRPVQAVTFAGGAFNNEWVAVTGASGDTLVTPSTVRFYRFTTSDSGDISPWLDLQSKLENPTAVEDMVWSPAGPCPSGADALYVAAPEADAMTAPNDGFGGIYCVDSNGNIATVHGDSARTLDIDRWGGFHGTHGLGTIYYSRWGGHHILPPDAELDDPALASPANRFRFATAGPHKGDLYMVGPEDDITDLWTLYRVTPEPHTAVPLGDFLEWDTSLTASHGGSFGELVAVASEASYTLYDLKAVVEEGGTGRTLDLARYLQCGRRLAFDSAGQHLAVVTAGADSSCHGPSHVHLLSFPLP